MDQAQITDQQIDEIAERYYNEAIARVRAALGKPIDPDDPAIAEGLEAIGKITNEKVSLQVDVQPSPSTALNKYKEKYCDGIGCATIPTIEQDAAASELLKEKANDDTLALRAFCERVYDVILYDEISVLIAWPHTYETDDQGNLHCGTGPAVAWSDSAYYYWHGQEIDEVVVKRPDEVKADYLLGLPAEKRRASYEVLGHERAIKILGLEPKDEATINGLEYVLYAGPDESWLKMQSPPLQDGSQPFYVEPVHEECETCAEALSWRATGDLDGEVRYELET